ncbi:MAG TPA: hypothetical protein VF757_10490 [Sphingomicrobium sp.]
MKFVTALAIGAIAGFILPMLLGGSYGDAWMKSFAAWGTVRPLANSPALLFSIPLFAIVTAALWKFFNWHNR